MAIATFYFCLPWRFLCLRTKLAAEFTGWLCQAQYLVSFVLISGSFPLCHFCPQFPGLTMLLLFLLLGYHRKPGAKVTVDGHECINLASLNFLGMLEREEITVSLVTQVCWYCHSCLLSVHSTFCRTNEHLGTGQECSCLE